ncbi:hypothetical protein [Butyrivibrio proteoclasticus]|nr:hypothetical protein [Butyrivibrio proteoclasticus]
MDYSSAYAIGAVFGSIMMGFILGAAPLIMGIKKKQVGLGVGGFVACIIASFILGLILGAPVCALFIFLIIHFDKKKNKDAQQSSDQNNNQQAV